MIIQMNDGSIHPNYLQIIYYYAKQGQLRVKVYLKGNELYRNYSCSRDNFGVEIHYYGMEIWSAGNLSNEN